MTFSTVRPLMNFWAAFSPSNEVRGVFCYLCAKWLNIVWYLERYRSRGKAEGVRETKKEHIFFELRPYLLATSTVYGLYRDGTELRGVYWSKMDVAMAACTSLGDTCDYPILLGVFLSSILRKLTASSGYNL